MGLLRLAVLLYTAAIVAVVALSWFPLQPGGPGQRLFDFLRRITDPVLAPLRRRIPPVGGMIDVSPMLVIFVLLIILGAL